MQRMENIHTLAHAHAYVCVNRSVRCMKMQCKIHTKSNTVKEETQNRRGQVDVLPLPLRLRFSLPLRAVIVTCTSVHTCMYVCMISSLPTYCNSNSNSWLTLTLSIRIWTLLFTASLWFHFMQLFFIRLSSWYVHMYIHIYVLCVMCHSGSQIKILSILLRVCLSTYIYARLYNRIS